MSTTIHINYPEQADSSKIEYVFDFLARHPHCPEGLRWVRTDAEVGASEILIYYGLQPPPGRNVFYIPAQQLVFSGSRPDCSTLVANIYTFADLQLHSVERKKEEPGLFLEERRFGFDLIEMLFFHLSRFEEYHGSPADWDEWDMMRADLQFLPRQELHEQAVVDQLVYAFFTALGFDLPHQSTEFSLSHDIDVFRKYVSLYQLGRSSVRNWLQKGVRAGQWELWKAYWATMTGKQKDPFDTFDWLLRERFEGEKYIYFLSGGITRFDRFYQIESSFAGQVISQARERGYSIGLHPSYACWKNKKLLLEEKKRLEGIAGEEIRHSRQHFLHFDHRQTLSSLEAAGLQTDSSLGYQDRIGFRCGTGFPYLLYDLERDLKTKITEIPLIVMDTALLMQRGEDAGRFEQHLQSFLAANMQQTRINFNFHNSTFDPLRLDSEAMKALYLSLFG